MRRFPLLMLVLLGALVGLSGPQSHFRSENLALLGVVGVPVGKARAGLRIVRVLEGSPADRGGLAIGDVLRAVEGERLRRPRDLDAALAHQKPGAKVRLTLLREDELLELEAELVFRGSLRGPWLVPRRQGTTDFEAPEWEAYAWGQLGKDEVPPTRTNTAGKVVVIHAFQSW